VGGDEQQIKVERPLNHIRENKVVTALKHNEKGGLKPRDKHVMSISSGV